jgi:hypothetical protein
VRDLINQMKTSTDANYCQRVTANGGELGNQHLRDFQDNEKTIPTILTTSQKLSTGVNELRRSRISRRSSPFACLRAGSSIATAYLPEGVAQRYSPPPSLTLYGLAFVLIFLI